LRRLARDWRFWVAVAAALYTIAGFLVVPLIAKRQIVAAVKQTLACDATIASIRFNPYKVVG
jgi:heme exporter protein D